MIKRSALWIVAVFAFVVFPSAVVAASAPAAPTLLSPAASEYHTTIDFVVEGVAPANTSVTAYLDDMQLVVRTTGEENGTLSFAATLHSSDVDVATGTYTVRVYAQDEDSGEESIETRQTVRLVAPAANPHFVAAVVNEESSWDRPWLVGLALNDTEVDVWVDGVYHGSVHTRHDDSGTGNFAFRPWIGLSAGTHTVTIRTRPAGEDFPVSEMVSETVTIRKPVVVTTSSQTSSNESTSTEGQDTMEKDNASTDAAMDSETKESTSSADAMEKDSGEDTMDGDDDSEESMEQDSATEEEAAAALEEEQDEAQPEALTTIGWVALLIAAIIVVVQMRRRQQEVDEIVVDGQNPNQQSFTFKPEKPSEHGSVQVIKNDKPQESQPDSSNDSSNNS